MVCLAGRDAVIMSADPNDGYLIRVERRGEAWRWVPDDAVVLLAQTRGCGPAAECLCPAITFRASRHRAEAHLRDCPDLTGVVLDQVQALEVARSSFGSLLVADVHNTPANRPATGEESTR